MRINTNRRRGGGYRFVTSVQFGVLVAAVLGVVSNENTRHQLGHPLPASAVATVGVLAAAAMFVLWSAAAMFRASSRRAAERARAAAAAERERERAGGRRGGRRYAGTPR
jgi:hypothetical protein